jgi:hypothetical protein
MGLNVVLLARWECGLFNQFTILSRLLEILAGLVSGSTIGNCMETTDLESG